MIPTNFLWFRRNSVRICRSLSESVGVDQFVGIADEFVGVYKKAQIRWCPTGIRRNPIGVLLKLNVRIPVGVTMIPVGIRRNQKKLFSQIF